MICYSGSLAGIGGGIGVDLPGVLQRFTFPDGPPYWDGRRLCLIHDTAEGRWGATARLSDSGAGHLSAQECDRLASRLADLLLALGHRQVVDRLSLLVRTVPDDGAEHQTWRASHEAPDLPGQARHIAGEMDATSGAVGVRHEVFVTASGPRDKLRRPAIAAGGGLAGRAVALYRLLDGLEGPFRTMGATTVQWLDSAGLAAALRTGFHPAVGAELAAAGLECSPIGPGGASGLPTGSYTHDKFATVSYVMLMPEAGTVSGSLAPLLAACGAGERRTVALHYEVLGARPARRATRGSWFRVGAMPDWRHAATGFVGGAEATGTVAGHSVVRFTAAAAVTVPCHANVEDHALRLESDASGRLLRSGLAQDFAFVVACLPVGLGFPVTGGASRL